MTMQRTVIDCSDPTAEPQVIDLTPGEIAEAEARAAAAAIEEAKPKRNPTEAIEKVAAMLVAPLILDETLDDDSIAAVSSVFPEWVAGEAVSVGDLRWWDGTAVSCLQAHTTQADWTPDVTPALWKIHRTTSGPSPDPWVQPTGGHDAYNIGDRVTFEGQVYGSLIAANVYSPTAYPQGWQLIT